MSIENDKAKLLDDIVFDYFWMDDSGYIEYSKHQGFFSREIGDRLKLIYRASDNPFKGLVPK